MTLLAYARTSTAEQVAGLESQVRDLQAFGCEKIFSERVSSLGKRVQFDYMLAGAKAGDVVVVTKLDRLARSVWHLLKLTREFEQNGISLVILSMSGERVDTRSPTGKLLLTMLGAVAEFERGIMLQRQAEGIAKAKALGLYKGRKPMPTATRRRIVLLRRAKTPIREIIHNTGVSSATIYRVLHEERAITRPRPRKPKKPPGEAPPRQDYMNPPMVFEE